MKRMERLLPLIMGLAALLTLAIAAGLDYLLNRLQLYGQSVFDLRPYLLALSAVDLFVVALLICIAWFADRLRLPSRLPGVVMLLLGVIAVFYPALTFIAGLGEWLPMAGPLSLSAHFRISGALLAVLGLYLIVRRNRVRRKEERLLAYLHREV